MGFSGATKITNLIRICGRDTLRDTSTTEWLMNYRQRLLSFAVWEKRNRPVIFANEKWIYDGKGNHVGFEVSLSGRPLNEIPS